MKEEDAVKALVEQCQIAEESCLYSSTIFFLWVRSIRWWEKIFIVAPIVMGSIATWSLLEQNGDATYKWVTGVCALLAGVLPAIHKALNINIHIEVIAAAATKFKNLQYRFRHAAEVTSLRGLEPLQVEYLHLLDQMDEARLTSITAPERFLDEARRKIKAGHYSPDVVPEDKRIANQ